MYGIKLNQAWTIGQGGDGIRKIGAVWEKTGQREDEIEEAGWLS